jgi:hypothetical protein
MPCSQTINLDLYIQILKTLQKHFRRVWPHKNVAEILLQHDNVPQHTSFKTRGAITKLRWTVVPHPPSSPGLSPSAFHLLQALTRCLGVMRRLLKQGRTEDVAVSTKFRLKLGEDSCSCLPMVQGCWSWWRLCRKNELCVIRPSSYHMSMFKESYNKLLSIKNCVAQLFAQPLYLPICMALHPRRLESWQHSCENLNSCFIYMAFFGILSSFILKTYPYHLILLLVIKLLLLINFCVFFISHYLSLVFFFSI